MLEIEAEYLLSPGPLPAVCVGSGTGWDDQFTLYLLAGPRALRSTQSLAEGW